MQPLLEHIEHPFAKGNLTQDGIQWSAEKTTSTDAYEDVESVSISPFKLGAVVEIEFGLTCAVKSSSTAEGVNFKWQARNRGGTWQDLHTAVNYPANASTYKEYTMSGRYKPATNFTDMPFDVRLVIQSAAAGGENAVGKTKNSSYIKVLSLPA